MSTLIRLLHRSGSVRVMLLTILLALAGGTLLTLASLRPRDAEPIDRAAYDRLMAIQIRGLDDLLDWFYDQQDQWVRIIPPGLEELIQPGLPDVVVLNLDGKEWPEALQKALSVLKPTWRNSVPTYELDLHENVNGEITISDISGNILYTVPTPNDYQASYEALFRQSINPLLYEPWLNRYKLRARITLLPQDSVEHYLYAKAEQEAYAQQQAIPELPMMLMSGGSEELAISGMELLTNGFRLTVSYPANFSGQVWSVYQQNTPALNADLTNSFNGLESIWSLIFDNLVLTGETATSWTDLQPMGSDTNSNPMHRFYGVGSNADSDNDELQSGYELFIAHTDAQNADSDGDSLLDGWELSYGLNAADPAGDNGAAGDPDADGLSNAEEQGLGSNPTEANSITVLSPAQVTVQYRSILATREKCGWQEFTQSNEPPVIYRRITQVANETDQWSGPETICSTSGVRSATVNYQATTYTNCNPDTGAQSNVYVSGYLSSAYAITHPPCPIWWRNDNLNLLTSGSWTGTITGFGPPYPSAYCSDPSGCSTGVSYGYSQRFEIANGTETITATQWSRTEEVAHEAPDQGMRVRNMTYTLSELYTTEDLAARVRAAVNNCAGWDDITWGNSRWVVGTNCVAQTGTEGNAWYDLTEDERTAKARALQYKISFSTVADQVYEVSWVEVFEGATTNVLQNRRVRKMGTGGVIELPVETIDPPAEEGIVYPVVIIIEIISVDATSDVGPTKINYRVIPSGVTIPSVTFTAPGMTETRANVSGDFHFTYNQSDLEVGTSVIRLSHLDVNTDLIVTREQEASGPANEITTATMGDEQGTYTIPITHNIVNEGYDRISYSGAPVLSGSYTLWIGSTFVKVQSSQYHPIAFVHEKHHYEDQNGSYDNKDMSLDSNPNTFPPPNDYTKFFDAVSDKFMRPALGLTGIARLDVIAFNDNGNPVFPINIWNEEVDQPLETP